MGLFRVSDAEADSQRRDFIDRCIEFDTPRLRDEILPSGVCQANDIVYDAGSGEAGLLDIYFPGEEKTSIEEAFVLVHGGAFVYGNKELDRNFGMHLCLASGLPVINVNYTLIPDTDVRGQISEICRAVSFCESKYGLRRIHMTGDSAGGYHAFLMSLLLNDPVMRSELRIDTELKSRCLSCDPICGAFRFLKGTFPGVYMRNDKSLPDYIFDLCKALRIASSRSETAPVVLVTGDRDTMLKSVLFMKKFCDKTGVECTLYNAVSDGDRVMHHVFPIAHPEWPESEEVIRLFVKNAGR